MPSYIRRADIANAHASHKRDAARAEHRYRITGDQGPYTRHGMSKWQEKMYCWLLAPIQQTHVVCSYHAARKAQYALGLEAAWLIQQADTDAAKWTPKGRGGYRKPLVHKGNREAWAKAEQQAEIDYWYKPSASGWTGD
jgi:hypothetical protein